MASKPRVTVLMSVYNGEKYLREAIDSILAQTFRDFEFVIYDDCSTDRSGEIIKSYSDSRIVYRRNETNQGLTKNLADGVARSSADYIARMDADDIAYPERLEKQVAWMDEHKEISILGAPVMYFNENDGDLGIAPQPYGDAAIKAKLFVSFTLMHPTIIIRAADLKTRGLNYNPDYRCSQDHALYLDCIRAGLKFENYLEPLLRMRAHAGSISRAKHGLQQECSSRARTNFLKVTGISDGCTQDEIDSYNSFASGYAPKTSEAVLALDGFVSKVLSARSFANYFDVVLIRQLFADSLSGMMYHAADKKEYADAIKAALSTSLWHHHERWPLKQQIKFLIKRMIAR